MQHLKCTQDKKEKIKSLVLELRTRRSFCECGGVVGCPKCYLCKICNDRGALFEVVDGVRTGPFCHARKCLAKDIARLRYMRTPR